MGRTKEWAVQHFVVSQCYQVSAFPVIYPVNTRWHVHCSCRFRKYQEPRRTHGIGLWKGSLFLFPDPFIPASFHTDGNPVSAGLSREGYDIRKFSFRPSGGAIRRGASGNLYHLGIGGSFIVPIMQMVWQV